MKILLLGDCHGRLNIVHRLCVRAQEQFGIQAAIQVGDFGFQPQVLHKFLHEGPRRFPVPLHAIDGNHEDHGWLRSARSEGIVTKWTSANLFVPERGSVSEIGGVRFGFLGGALNADRRQEWSGQWAPLADEQPPPNKRRIPKDPVWANWVTDGDVERSATAFSLANPDVVITHSCPAGIGIGMVGSQALFEDVEKFIVRAGHYCGPFTDCGEGGLTRLWSQLKRRPANWIFGHFHRLHDRVVDQTRFVCVGSSDGSDGARFPRTVLYDTEHQQVLVEPVAT